MPLDFFQNVVEGVAELLVLVTIRFAEALAVVHVVERLGVGDVSSKLRPVLAGYVIESRSSCRSACCGGLLHPDDAK